MIPALCHSAVGYQLINPTRSISLSSTCLDSCPTVENITWNVYRESSEPCPQEFFSSGLPFQYIRKISLLVTNTNHFTMVDDLFLEHSRLWKFEVAYTLRTGRGLSAPYFLIDQCPFNGSCSITPNNGTITTSFTLSCSNWFDENEIKDYSLYIWTPGSSESVMVAFSAASTFQVRLSVGNNSDGLMNLVVYIRDQLDCVTKYDMLPVNVLSDQNGNRNTIGQVIPTLSQEFNQMNHENVQNVILGEFSFHSIKLQTLSLAELIHATNQLTQLSLIIPSTKCYELTKALHSISPKLSYEDIQLAVTLITQCASDVLNVSIRSQTQSLLKKNIIPAINGPLQQRVMLLLDLDLSRSFDLNSMQTANEIQLLTKQILSLLSLSLNIRLHFNETFLLKKLSVFMSLEKYSSSQYRRTLIEPLSPIGSSQANMNLSRAVPISLVDQDGISDSMRSNYDLTEIYSIKWHWNESID
ncbi:unnamed protein product [Adineta ricciae]|nr:unnamed protein product [Adineta ricciae]